MWIEGTYNLILDNDISDVRNKIKGVMPNSMQADGIEFFNVGNIYRGNYIHDMKYANQDYSGEPPHIDAFQCWGQTAAPSDTIIERNHVKLFEHSIHANTTMHAFMLGAAAHDIIVRNNIFEVNSFLNTGASNAKRYNLYFYNNTIISSLDFWADPYASYAFNLEYVEGVVDIYNNITVDFETHYRKTANCTATVTRKNNGIFNSDDSTPTMTGLLADPTDLWMIDALFTTEFSDLHLQSSSLYIDAGYNLFGIVANDYAGTSRPQGAGYDMGAYEYQLNIPPSITGVSITGGTF
jgi:hypothetical protein